VEELFQAAVDLAAEERARFLEKRCGSDTALRAEVTRLLGAYDTDVGDFLGTPAPRAIVAEPRADFAVTDRAPEVIAHYRIEREIGRGGMGRVYLATDEKLGRQVAVKLLPEEFSRDPGRRALFEREARTAARLNHPNIAIVHELGEFEGGYFIAMELVEGHSIRDRLANPEPLPLRDLLDIAGQLLEGLAAAHGRSIVHRDLKPGNIMVAYDGRVKILDFGLAKPLHGDAAVASGAGRTSLTRPGAVVGTVDYMSPEQARGEPVDFRSDLFSVGVVFYEMVARVPPFQRPSVAETLSAILHEEPPPVASLNPRIPPDLARIVERLLAKRPEDRPASSAAALTDLERVRRAVEARARRRPVRIRWMTAAAVVLVAIAIGAWAWLRDPGAALTDPPRPPPDPPSDERLHILHGSLSAGDLDAVGAILDVIRESGREYPVTEEAVAIFGEAERLVRELAELPVAIDRLCAKGRLQEAWEAIRALGALQFEGRPITVVQEAAKRFRRKLIDLLEKRIEDDGVPRAVKAQGLALLGRVQPWNRHVLRWRPELTLVAFWNAMPRLLCDLGTRALTKSSEREVLVTEFRQALAHRDFESARELLDLLEILFPGDPELERLRQDCDHAFFEDGLEALRRFAAAGDEKRLRKRYEQLEDGGCLQNKERKQPVGKAIVTLASRLLESSVQEAARRKHEAAKVKQKAAGAWLNRAIDLDDANARPWYWRGMARVYLARDRFKKLRDKKTAGEALADFRQAVKLGFAPADLHFEMAALYQGLEKWREAIKCADDALRCRLTPDDLRRIGALWETSSLDELRRLLRRDAHVMCARAHLQLKRLDDCIRHCDAAIEENREFSPAYYLRGVALAKSQSYAEARKDLVRVSKNACYPEFQKKAREKLDLLPPE